MRHVKIVISWKFNFFAETLLRHMRPSNTWVFHINKTDKQLAAFDCPSWVSKSVVIKKQMFHSVVLDCILIRQEWPEIIEHDAVLFVDHDAVIANGRDMDEQIGNRLLAGISSGYAISAMDASYWNEPDIRLFLTTPMFAVNPKTKWPCSWDPAYNPFLDTGQKIAFHESMKGKMDIWDWPVRGLLHWGSHYSWMEASFCRDVWTPEQRRWQTQRYTDLAKTGLWKAKACDVDRLLEFPLLSGALEVMAQAL